MSPAPFQPIPETTQAHVDRLVGSQVGELDVGERVAEGRFGTLYRARRRASGKDVTLEVLRTGLRGNDHDVRAVNAIKCAGIAEVVDFGELPDGRRYRVMERLEGESLDQRVLRGDRFTPAEVVQVLGQVAEVLQAAHAWALPHGNLGSSTVFVFNGAVKLLDFGLAKQKPTVEGDLHALGALGFMLLTGVELGERAPPPAGTRVPDGLDRLLRELLEKRVKDATAARRAFARGSTLTDDAPALMASVAPGQSPSSAAAPRSRALLVGALALLLVGGGAAALVLLRAPAAETVAAVEDEGLTLDEALAVDPDEPPEPEPTATEQRPSSRPTVQRRTKVVPSAGALMAEITRLESRFRQQAHPDDADQALNVLNKQRLRLTGTVSERDRKDVARQLAGWRRSYLRR
ncbi:MAG: protein kinase [Myxococcales bacterium]|nr:protein kinase [Myxococcales bacterium]